jgi:hypothetical protein
MATYAAEQPATLGRRPTVSVGVPIVASKITAPGWAVPRARITTLIAHPSRRLPATLVTRCPLRLLPSVKALRGAAAASRSEHP